MQRVLFSMLALVAVSSFVLVGCSDDSPGSDDITSPKAGSTYNYSAFDAEDGDTTDYTIVATVKAENMSYAGRTGVVHFEEVSTTDSGTESSDVYLKYEDNGDVSLSLSSVADFEDDSDSTSLLNSVGSNWITIPFGSQESKTVSLVDTSYFDVDFDDTVSVKLSVTTSYLREETATVDGNELKIWVGKLTMTGSLPFPLLGDVPITGESTIYFAPEIGYLYKREGSSSAFGFASYDGQLLTSYTLK